MHQHIYINLQMIFAIKHNEFFWKILGIYGSLLLRIFSASTEIIHMRTVYLDV